MSLVTRCPGCATLFRVVPDQIRIAAGWVRCGQCGEVFEAAEHMLPYGESVQATGGQPAAPAAQAAGADAGQPQGEYASRPQALAPEAGPGRAHPPEPAPAPAPENRRDEANGLGGQSGPVEPVEQSGQIEQVEQSEQSEQSEPIEQIRPGRQSAPDEPDEPHDDEAGPPSMFMAKAPRRRGFWASRAGRRVLWTALPLLLLALLLQAALTGRDWLAARAPGLAPALGALCAPLGCRVQPYRQLEAINLVSSPNLIRLGADSFRLGFTLRNTADWPVAAPALELVLIDAQDLPLARRVVMPADLGAPPALAARDEFNGVMSIAVGGAVNPDSIAGYRLERFYP